MNYNILRDSESCGRLLEIGKVEEVSKKNSLLKVSFANREGFLEEVVLLGTYKPVKDDIGLIFYAGKCGYPFFLPYYSGQQYSNAGEDTVILYKDKGSPDVGTNNWVNLQDVGADAIKKGMLISYQIRDNQWGEENFIKAIIKGAIDWYSNPKNINHSSIIKIGDISNKYWYKISGNTGGKSGKGHEGWGHKTGRGADMTTTDGLDNEINVQSDERFNLQIELMKTIFNAGVLKLMHTNDKYQNAYTRLFEDKVRRDNHGKHRDHFHISNIPFEEGTGF